jgi:hypothetical protein
MAIYIDASLSFEFWIENGSPGIRVRRFIKRWQKKQRRKTIGARPKEKRGAQKKD